MGIDVLLGMLGPLSRKTFTLAHISHSALQERAGLPSLRQMGRCPWPGRWDFSK